MGGSADATGQGRAVRGAAGAAAVGAALLYLALGWRLGATAPSDRWWERTGGALGALAAAASPLLILPSLARVSAHPRTATLPAPSARAAAAGTAGALYCLGGALVTALPRAVRPMDVAALVVLVAAGAAVAVSGVLLHRARSTPSARGAVVAVRPDLLDDLSILVARVVPGSAPARAADRVNRRLDAWRGPRRAAVRPVAPDYGRATVTATSPDAADTVTVTPPVEGTARVTAGARATTV